MKKLILTAVFSFISFATFAQQSPCGDTSTQVITSCGSYRCVYQTNEDGTHRQLNLEEALYAAAVLESRLCNDAPDQTVTP